MSQVHSIPLDQVQFCSSNGHSQLSSVSLDINTLDTKAAICQIMQQVSNLMTIQRYDYNELSRRMHGIQEILIGATKMQFFYLEKNELILADGQISQELSLPRYICSLDQGLILNEFNHLQEYRQVADQCYKEYNNMMGVPLIDQENVCQGVILLFDKYSMSGQLIDFCDTDLTIIQSVQQCVCQIIQMIKQRQDFQNKMNIFKQVNKQYESLLQFMVKQQTKESLLQFCEKNQDNPEISQEQLLILLRKIIDCDCIAYSTIEGSSLKPVKWQGQIQFQNMSQIVKIDDIQPLLANDFINIENIQNDETWISRSITKMKSLLVCPLRDENELTIGAFEFYRKHDKFNVLDELFTSQIMTIVKRMALNDFWLQKQESQAAQWTLFSLNQNSMHDYSGLINNIKQSVIESITVDTCSVYFVDQVNEYFWTQVSNDCEALKYPIQSNEFLGKVYLEQREIDIPYSEEDDQSIFGLPIICKNMQYPIIGALIITRKFNNFSKFEKVLLRQYLRKISKVLEIYFFKDLVDLKENEQIADKTSFKTLNTQQSASSLFKLEGLSPEIQQRCSPFFSFSEIPNNLMIDLSSIISQIKQSEFPLQDLALKLRQLVECEEAKLYLLDETQSFFIDMGTGSLIKSGGLIRASIDIHENFMSNNDVELQPRFNKHSDSLGISGTINSLLIVPIISHTNNASGAFVFANSPSSFREDELHTAIFLTLIPKELMLMEENSKNFNQTAAKISQRKKQLQQWCKRVFIVYSTTQSKFQLCQSIMHQLYSDNDLESVIILSLDVISAMVDAELTGILFYDNNQHHYYQQKEGKMEKQFLTQEKQAFKKAIMSRRSIYQENVGYWSNLLLVPCFKSDNCYVVIECWNKRDETLTFTSNFTKEDEILISRFARSLGACLWNPSEQNLSQAQKMIREYVGRVNTHSLISTIRTACQKLIQCDRATVFTVDGDNLIVQSQGLEQEIPVGTNIPIGKGIVGYVAQTGQTENIQDAYSDQRFNPDIDKATGYKTKSILCMPVLDYQGGVIAALQMINKKNGGFDKNDEDILDVFCEMVSTVLQSWNQFQKMMEEKTKLINIMDSIGNYILVLNDKGQLNYSNKPIESLLGVDNETAKQGQYSQWLRYNKQLVYDITSVRQCPSKRIRKLGQPITKQQQNRRMNMARMRQIQFVNTKPTMVDYSISSLKDFYTLDASGIVLIIEINENRNKQSESSITPRSALRSFKISTSMQKCIENLTLVSKSMDAFTNEYLMVDEVIKILKEGNIYKAKIIQGLKESQLENEVKSQISEYMQIQEDSLDRSIQFHQRPRPSIDLEFDHDELKSWDLNTFTIENPFIFVKAVLADLKCFQTFEIDNQTLLEFTINVKKHYETWENPFHNFYHGLSVMHTTYLFLRHTKAGELFQIYEKYALIIAGLCHDIEHTGHTNQYEINRGSRLAIQYNDKSVLEQHHCALTFRILQQEKCNIFNTLSQELMKFMRKLIIGSILGTDMLKHFNILHKMQQRFTNLEEIPMGNGENDIENAAKLLLHTADLSHPIKAYEVFSLWSTRVCEEFTRQYQDEIRFGLQPTAFMKDLDQPLCYFKNEVNFLTIMIEPLWKCVDLWLQPDLDKRLAQLNLNIKEYKDRQAQYAQSD